MRTITKTLILASVIALASCDALDDRTTRLNDAKEQGVLSVFGFYADMTVEDYDAVKAELKANDTDPFVRWFRTVSEDGKVVPAIGLAFPHEKFMEVAKEVAKENGGKLNCTRTDITVCEMEGKTGDTLVVSDFVFKVDGKAYGAVALADRDHANSKDPKTAPENEKHEQGDLSKENTVPVTCPAHERNLNGRCVTDL